MILSSNLQMKVSDDKAKQDFKNTMEMRILFSMSDSLVLLTYSAGPLTDLFCHALNIGCHFFHGEDGSVT